MSCLHFLELQGFFITCIVHSFFNAVLTDNFYIKLPTFEHPFKISCPIVYCKRFGIVVPYKSDGREFSIFVIIVIAFVFVKGKLAVGSFVNSELKRFV